MENLIVHEGIHTIQRRPRNDIYAGVLMYDKIVNPLFIGLIRNLNDEKSSYKNTIIIQDALNVGGDLLLPEGKYYIDGGLLVHISNTVLRGNNTTLVIANPLHRDIFMIHDTDEQIHNVTIKDLHIDGNDKGSVNSSCISMMDCSKCLLTDVIVENYNGNAVLLYAHEKDCLLNKITRCTFDNIKGCAILLKDLSVAEENDNKIVKINFIDENHIENINGPAGIVVSGCNNIVKNNYISKTFQCGIYLNKATKCIVNDNILLDIGQRDIYDTGLYSVVRDNIN